MSGASEPTLREQGYPPPDPPPVGHMPAGGSTWLVPAYLQALSLIGQRGRAFWWTHDEALRDSQTNADAMWSDPVISGAITDRIRPVAMLEWQMEPRTPTDPAEKRLADLMTEIFEDIPRFQDLRVTLLRAIWSGRSGVQIVFGWDKARDSRLIIKDWMPIDGDSLVFKWDGQIGILCNPILRGKPGVETIEGRAGTAYFPPADKQQALIVHEFEPMAAPFFRPEMHGSVHGSGMRGRVYWPWWLKHNMQRLAFNFVRKAGNGFFLAGYDPGNRDELSQMQIALEAQDGNPIIYVPMAPGRDFSQVLQHLQTSMTGADFQWKIVESLNELIRDTILGESQANGPSPAGLNSSGMAEQRGMNDDERVKYDAIALETPLQKLVNVICRYTAPGVRPPRFQHMCDKRNPQEFMEALQFALQAGLSVGEDDVRSELGLPKPNEGDPVLAMVQPQQAAALGSVPGGVPMAGTPGPAPGAAGGGGPTEGTGSPDDTELESQIQPMSTGQ